MPSPHLPLSSAVSWGPLFSQIFWSAKVRNGQKIWETEKTHILLRTFTAGTCHSGRVDGKVPITDHLLVE